MANDTSTIRRILEESRTIAVVGLSPALTRPSHEVAKYLQKHGYRIIPVNPRHEEVLGEKSYPDLSSIPERVDVVEVFRRPEETVRIAKEAVAIGARVLWLQLGIENDDARQVAEAGGLTVVMNHCMKIEHSRFFSGMH